MKQLILIASIAAFSAFAAPASFAKEVQIHPALKATVTVSAIDPNTFIVGHPASPKNKRVHANGHHPAVILNAPDRKPAGIDPNTFIVQPPASVTWTVR